MIVSLAPPTSHVRRRRWTRETTDIAEVRRDGSAFERTSADAFHEGVRLPIDDDPTQRVTNGDTGRWMDR